MATKEDKRKAGVPEDSIAVTRDDKDDHRSWFIRPHLLERYLARGYKKV